MSHLPTDDKPSKAEFSPGVLGRLARSRHAFGASAAVLVAWYPVVRGMEIYRHVVESNQCGFLCMFLWPAMAWWVGAFFLGIVVWIVVAWTLYRLGRP
jgi:hypothetical protein